MWKHQKVATSDLLFWDGAGQTTFAAGLPIFPQYDYRAGYAVWAQDGDIFGADTTVTPPAIMQITGDGAVIPDTDPKTDGISVVWRQVDGADEHVMLYNLVTGAQERISTNTEVKDGASFWIDYKQVLWWECNGGAPCLNANTSLLFHDGNGTAAGTTVVPQPAGVLVGSGFRPYIDEGDVVWIGDDGNDTEIFCLH